MQSDLLSCPVCYVHYNEVDHLPKMIPVCGHTLCSACLNQILQKNKQCPLDRAKLQKTKSFPTNYVVLQLVKEKQANEYGICFQHSKPKNLVCSVDYLMICEECLPIHKDHRIQSVEDIKKEAQVQKKKLQAVIDGIASHRERVESLLIESKKIVLTNLIQEFEKVREAIKQKEREIFCMVELAFEDRKDKVGKILEKDALLREKCRVKMSDLETPMNVRFFKTLEKLEGKAFGHSVREQEEKTTSLDEQYACDLQKFSSLLNFKIHNICFMISDILKTNMIEIYKPEPLERVLQIEIQGHKFEASPCYCSPHESSALDYHLMKNMKSFSVVGGNNFTYEHFRALKSIYTYCDKISEIELYFDRTNDNDDNDGGICHFYSDLYWATNQIESLTINLDGKYEDNCFITLAKNVLPKMTSIKELALFFKKSEITDKSLQILAGDFLKNAVNLSKFFLDLAETGITDLGVAELCQNINPSLINTKKFGLGLSITKITDKSVDIILQQGICYMNSLEVFKLHLIGTCITDQGILALCNNADNLLKTKKFELSIGKGKITEKSIVMLSDKIISKMPLLESLSLLLTETRLTDQGFIKFYTQLTQIARNLKRFILNVEENLITETSIGRFARQLLPELKKIKNFQLNLGKTVIKDKIFQELCEGFTPILRRAETFVLVLQDWENPEDSGVSEDGVEMIIDLVNLESMPNLKTFIIDHPITSDEGKRVTQKLIKIKKQLSLRQK